MRLRYKALEVAEAAQSHGRSHRSSRSELHRPGLHVFDVYIVYKWASTLACKCTGDQVYYIVFQFLSKLHLLLTSSAHSDMWSSDGMYKVATFDVGVMCSTHCVPDLALSYSIVSLVYFQAI